MDISDKIRNRQSAIGNTGRTALPIIGALCAVGVLGAGGWYIAMLHQQTVQHLKQTRANLEEKSSALALVEQQRQQLSTDYEALKNKWSDTDRDLQHVTTTAAQTKAQLDQIASERADLQRHLTDTQQQSQALQAQMDRLQRQVKEEAQRRVVLESQMAAALSNGLTRAEIEQVSNTLQQQQRQASILDDRMQALSHAFEQLAWKHMELQEATGQSAPPGAAPSLDEPVAALGAAPLSRREERQYRQQANLLATRYRHLGDFCFSAYQYPRAAEAYERSLEYQDDPEVHAALAFLYSRLLLDPQRAAWHAMRAPEHTYTAKDVLDSTTATKGFPRQDHKLVWQWLTGAGESK